MMNQIVHGDCLDILQAMPAEWVNLVYLDPPFFTQSTQTLKSKNLIEYAFDDNWDSISDYIEFLRKRLIEIRRVMKANATIFVHCDRNASHYIRVLLDEIFGYDRFLSEIIWTYRRWSNARNNLLPAHQTIFMYAKSEQYVFHKMYQDYSETTNLDQILQKRERDEHGKSIYATDDTGEIILNGPKQGVPLSDTWDIPYLNPKAKERTGYPTQKPLLLLERIIQLSSNKGDIVLDPFCGSATTCVAAKLLDRQYIGIDISLDAVQMGASRIENPIRSSSNLLEKGRDAYNNLPEYVVELLKSLPVKLVQRNNGIDAIHDRYIEGQPIVIRVQRSDESLIDAANKLEQAGKKKKACLMLLIHTQEANQQSTFLELMPDNVIVLDSLNILIQEQIDTLIEKENT